MSTWSISTYVDEMVGIAENAMAISTLVKGVTLALQKVHALEPIWEVSEKCPSIGRAAVQFHVSLEIFHSFFNAEIGYRAMFRRGPQIGIATNAALVTSIRDLLSGTLPESVTAHLIEFGPKWKGRTIVARSEFLRSLDPSLGKAWYSTAEIGSNGEIRLMSTGVSSEKIDVGLAYKWAEIRQEPHDCILEVKGAFVGKYGLFQLKDPDLRARTLFSRGEA